MSKQNFRNQFEGRSEVIYADKPLEVVGRLKQKKAVDAVKVIVTAGPKRKPTREDFLESRFCAERLGSHDKQLKRHLR